MKIEFEGMSFEMKIYTAEDPAALVKAHALDAGPPFVPPRWLYSAWRWRDDNYEHTNYYDGTQATGPFNTDFMEDVLMMKAFGIPCGVIWIDRPWGPGSFGYDDFKIDGQRLPNFAESVKWLNSQNTKMVLWIGPFFQGEMPTNALAWGYTLASRARSHQRNNYPMVDLTNPEAKKYWQDGVAKLLKMGVAGFKLDRGEENIPESGPYQVFDGRSIRENRNAYPPMYVKAIYDVAEQISRQGFCLDAALGLHRQFALQRFLGRRYWRHTGGIARFHHRGAARGGDGISQLGLGHLRLQSGVAGHGSLRALAGF